jgi:hypothetical protein
MSCRAHPDPDALFNTLSGQVPGLAAASAGARYWAFVRHLATRQSSLSATA